MASEPGFLSVISVGFTNSYALNSGEGLILIDTGISTDQNWQALTEGLHSSGYDIRQVRLVLLTHSHFDHSGLAARVRQASGAQVLIHQDDAPFLADASGWRGLAANHRRLLVEHGVPQRLLDWFERMGERRGRGWFRDWRRQESLFDERLQVRWEVLEQEAAPAEGREDAGTALQLEWRPTGGGDRNNHTLLAFVPPWVTPDRTFEDGEVIALGQVRLRAVHTPGHTPGHACFVHEESGLIFTGDHILKRITPHPGIVFHGGRYEQRTRSLPQYLASLEKVRDLAVQRVLPAHEDEPPELRQAVDRILKHHERRAVQTQAALRAGRTTAFDILPYLFPNLRAFAVWTAVPEVIGHLDLLEQRGEVEAMQEGNLITYRLTGKALGYHHDEQLIATHVAEEPSRPS